MKVCPNCGLQIEPRPNSLSELPVEVAVALDDSVRLYQLKNPEAPHSANLVSGAPRHGKN